MKISVVFLFIVIFLLIACSNGLSDMEDDGGRITDYRCPNCNVILIVIDTLRADHLGSYGYSRNTTPNIDRFADENILFENMFSNAPATLPAVTALFTSLYPNQHNVVYPQDVLNDNLVTMAEILNENGFNTYGISRKDNYDSEQNCNQGFMRWRELDVDGPKFGYDNFIGNALSDEIDHYKKPFFLFLHYNDPHSSYVAPESYFKFFNKDYDGDVNGTRPYSVRYFKDRPDELKQLVSFYDNEIRWSDYKIGQLFNNLKNEGLYDNSIIILLSDHGEMFLDHGYFEHSNGLFNEIIKVPLIMKIPGYNGDNTFDNYVQTIDILPTTLDILNITSEYSFMGDSIFSVINEPNRLIFSEHLHLRATRPSRSLVIGKYKLIEDFNSKKFSLYDLEGDYLEKENIIDTDPNAKKFIKQMKNMVQKSSSSDLNVDRITDNIDEATIEKLKALGYVT